MRWHSVREPDRLGIRMANLVLQNPHKDQMWLNGSRWRHQYPAPRMEDNPDG